MALSLVTAPAVEPLTLDEAKRHLRVDVDDENELINTLLVAAREWIESYTHRKLITQTWDDKRDAFPCSDEVIELPFPPVSSVTSITYVDTSGTSQTWTSSLYTTDLPSGPQARRARIYPAYGEFYPSTRGQMNAVTVRFVCGYGSSGASVPSALIAAMKLLIGHWYVHRETVAVGTIAQQVPMGVAALAWPYKAF